MGDGDDGKLRLINGYLIVELQRWSIVCKRRSAIGAWIIARRRRGTFLLCCHCHHMRVHTHHFMFATCVLLIHRISHPSLIHFATLLLRQLRKFRLLPQGVKAPLERFRFGCIGRCQRLQNGGSWAGRRRISNRIFDWNYHSDLLVIRLLSFFWICILLLVAGLFCCCLACCW